MASTNTKGVENIADSEMKEVQKDLFFEGMVLPVCVYLKMTQGNYLLIGKTSDKAQFSNLHAFSNDTVGVFVRNNDYPIFMQLVAHVTGKLVTQKNVPDAVKVKFLASILTDALENLEKSGFSSASKIQKVSQLVIQTSQNLSVFSQILDAIKDLPNEETKHAMTTCLVSMLICDEMNITLPLAKEKVAMGALLHDVGLKFIPKSILDKPRHLWDPGEQQIFELHPLKGIEALRDMKDLPSDVILIVAEHHENAQGTGFPKRMRDIKVSPLARIVALANFYAGLIFNSKPDGKSYSADEAIQYVEEIMGQPFNKQAFLALKNIVNKKHLADKS
jgi:putative nucleotidyltransferase with HDIG domain